MTRWWIVPLVGIVLLVVLALFGSCVPTPTPAPVTITPTLTTTPLPSFPDTPTPIPSPLIPELVKSPTPAPTPDGGFLLNSSMERPYSCSDNMCVPQYWHGWTPPLWPCRPLTQGCDLPCPSTCLKPNGNCENDSGCMYAAAEFSEATLQFTNRVHSGASAVNIFARARMFDAVLYQQFYHVPMGSSLHFSIWGHAWQCFQYVNCQWGELSDVPAEMNIQVGIDPYGGYVPTSTQIIWSAPGESFDHWSQFDVSAIAKNQVVTVFAKCSPRWDWPRNDGNNCYFDDARLDVVQPFTPTSWIYLPIATKQ